MAETFVKLFGSILDSSVWDEDTSTRIVWITLLAMCDARGYVGAALPGVARRARVSLEDAARALDKFAAPDPYSRSTEHDGRRIEKVERGWQILNYQRYREMRDTEQRKEQYRAAKRRQREKSKRMREIQAFDKALDNEGPPGTYEEP